MNIKAAVISSCENVVKEYDESINVTEEMEISIENGIDSLGIVSIILDIEEQLDIELDEYLSQVRRSKTIGDLIRVVEKVIENK